MNSALTHSLAAFALCFSFAGLTLAQDATPPAASPPAVPQPPKDDGKDPAVKRDVTHYNLGKDDLAIEGYDPVAYFPEGGGKPLKGDKKLAYTYRGVTYWFANEKNRDTFKNDPRKYEPAHGGWCSSAMADGGRKVEIDPSNFKITDGRLFLFYKSVFQNALTFWNKNEAKNTADADGNWRTLTKEEPRKPQH